MTGTNLHIYREESRGIGSDLADCLLCMRYSAKFSGDIYVYCYGWTARGAYRRALRKQRREARRQAKLMKPPRRQAKLVREYTEIGERVR